MFIQLFNQRKNLESLFFLFLKPGQVTSDDVAKLFAASAGIGRSKFFILLKIRSELVPVKIQKLLRFPFDESGFDTSHKEFGAKFIYKSFARLSSADEEFTSYKQRKHYKLNSILKGYD